MDQCKWPRSKLPSSVSSRLPDIQRVLFLITDPFSCFFCHSQSTFHISKVMLWISKVFCSRSGGTSRLLQLQLHWQQPGDDTIREMTGLFLPPLSFLPLSFYPMLCLPNFLIWSTASPQAAVAEQLGTVGSDGGRHHHKTALLPNMPQSEWGELWRSSLHAEK